MSETPSAYMFSDLRTFGRLTNRDAALELLSDTVLIGGKTPRTRINDRTFLSRQIVHARPGQVNERLFGDFFQSSQTLTSRIISKRTAIDGCDETEARRIVTAHYAGPAAEGMQAVLRSFDLDETTYANAVMRIGAAKFRCEADRTVLYVMLFLATGCLSNPQRAVSIVDRFTEYKLAMDVDTIEMSTSSYSILPEQNRVSEPDVRLGLLRLVNGIARPPIYPLSIDRAGTIVGSLPDGKNVVNDVDVDISRQHLHIWRENNTWWAQGLGSTNGTILIPGNGGHNQVIEPARAKRVAGVTYDPVQIDNSDILRLGATTKYLVMRIAP